MESELSLPRSGIEMLGAVHERTGAVRKAESGFQYLNRGNPPEKKIVIDERGTELLVGRCFPEEKNALIFPESSKRIVSESFRDEVIERYKILARPEELSNARDKESGAQLAYSLLIDDLFLQENIPLLEAMHKTAWLKDDKSMLGATSAAFIQLDRAFGNLDDASREKSENLYSQLLQIKTKAHDKDPRYLEQLRNFDAGMIDAGLRTAVCLNDFVSRIDPGMKITLPDGKEAVFGETAAHALREYKEAVGGADLGEEFKKQLEQASALVVSIDINSVLNSMESYPTVELTAKAKIRMDNMVSKFKKQFPEKEILFVLNTGRSVIYAQGVLEQLLEAPEARRLALAESGGVVIKMKGNRPEKQVAVENSEEWGKQLEGLWDFLRSKIKTPEVTRSSKVSVLSLRLANKDGYLLQAKEDGATITEKWIEQNVKDYLENAGKNAGEDSKALETINNMQENLVPLWNPTAGFVDIGHRGLNKYSTLNKEVKKELKERYGENAKTCIIHIGDSSTDKMPTEKMGPGEVNEGADKVFLAGVHNSNEGFRKAVEVRGNRGIMVAGPSILGFDAIIHGVNNAIGAAGDAKDINKQDKAKYTEGLLFNSRI